MNKRIVNIRPLFVVFIGMILGMLTFYFALNVVFINKDILPFILFCLIFILLLILYFLSFFKNNKYLFKLFKFRYVFLAFVVSIFIGSCLLAINVSTYMSKDYLNGKFSCTGYVSECVVDNRDLKIVLTDCIVGNDKNYDIDRLNLIISDCDERIPLGTRVSFKGKISSTKLFTDKNNVLKFYKNKIYNVVVSSESIDIGDVRDIGIIDSVREGIRTSLEENLNDENSGIAYAMLLGDKSGIDTENYNMFSYAGVSHILAVSGLHVGFLVGLILLLLSLFKTKDLTNLIIVSVILTLYCILCKMSPSVVRASIMSIVLLGSKCIGEEYDPLSSLSFAGIIILLLNPVQLFDIGFQLSFLCVLSIITLSKYATDVLIKIHVPKIFASILAMSVCITFAIYPLCTNIFETTSIIGVFTNLIIIPLFSIAFPVLFVFSILSALLPFMGFSMCIPEMLLHAIKLICDRISNISFGNFKVFSWGYVVVFLVVIIMLVIKFLMLSSKLKNIVLSVLLSVTMLLVVIGELPKIYNDNQVLTWSQYETCSSIVTTEDNYKILIDYDTYSTVRALKDYKISKIDEWIYPTFDLTKIDKTKEILQKYKIKKLVLPNNNAFNTYSLAKLNGIVEIVYIGEKTAFNKYTIEYFTDKDGRTYAVSIETNKKLLFEVSMTKEHLENFESDKEYDYCITKNDEYDLSLYIEKAKEIISTTKIENENNKNNVKSICQKSQYVIKL